MIRRGDRITMLLFALLVVWAAIPLAWLTVHALRDGVVLSGSNGALAGADQLFYLDSIRQSGTHLLIADNFALALGRAVFLHPLYLLAGVLWRAGLPLQGAFWLLGLPAAGALAVGATRLASLALAAPRVRALAAVLGLFYLSPLVALLVFAHRVSPLAHFQLDFPAGESMTAWQLWGYPHTAIAVGLLAVVLCEVVKLAEWERTRVAGGPDSGSRAARTGAVAAAAALVGWFHPWQGAILIALTLLVALTERSAGLARRLFVVVLAAGTPMVYEQLLVHTDAAWRLDSARNQGSVGPLWMLLAALLPLALPALAGARSLRSGPTRIVLIGWPVAALLILFITSEFPDHALEGIALPLAVLAMRPWTGAPGRAGAGAPKRPPRALTAVGAVAATAAVVAGGAYEAGTFHDSLASGVAPYWLDQGDRAALSYLERERVPGGVFARYYLGMAVPAFTGRATWVGEFTWTPDFLARQVSADGVIDGVLAPAQARAVVVRSGARFVLRDCRSQANLRVLLGPLVGTEHHFGCAAVYALRRGL